MPSGVSQPIVDGYNYSSMSVDWERPRAANGPEPRYAVTRMEASFNTPPFPVTRGVRFPGGGYYLFPPDNFPQGVSYTGNTSDISDLKSTFL